jgi:orotate phosphoribosyltransferase
MMATQLETLALKLYDIGAVKMGRFTLHSGKTSPIYLDLRLLVSYPQALQQVAEAYTALLKTLTFDILAAYPYAGLPIGTAIALHSGWPLIYPRKMAKQYGTGKQVEGAWQVGQTAVVIEDLITSGDSILQAIASLKAAGLQVNDAAVLIDRQQGGRKALEAEGYQLYAVLTMAQLLNVLEEHKRITARQRAKVLEGLS